MICGECGGSYGLKVRNFNDRYRRIVYQCNRKYKGDKRCETPIVTKEDIENKVINIINNMIANNDDFTENLKFINKTIFDTEKL